jgi:hypothetical protein
MDEASRLVSELQSKLAALDDKVARYQRDMASEFTKYAADLLRNVSKDVSEDVSRRIAQSVDEYPSLNLKPGIVESCASATSSSNGGGAGALNVESINTGHMGNRQDDDDESSRSPHEREKEFQGLFTPFYLPLLDSNDRNERRSGSESRAIVADPASETKDMETETVKVDASTDTRSLSGTPEAPRPPLPKRRNTDEVSSGSSEFGEGIHRRSALRRSSTSSTRTSPRRVRFEVEGEEVLPTSSPYSSELTMTRDLPPTYQILNEDLEELEDVAQSEQIEDVDEEPPPRRVSSSQALRALSRSPFVDDGTQWTTVTAPPDGSASIAISDNSSALFTQSSADDVSFTNGSARASLEDNMASSVSVSPMSTFTSQNTTANSRTSQTTKMPSSHDILDRHDAHDPEYSSDEDDMLDMPALTSMKGKRSTAAQPTSPSSATSPMRSPNATNRPGMVSLTVQEGAIKKDDNEVGTLRFSAEDEDEMFSFEENEHRPSPTEPEEEGPESSSPISPPSATSADDVHEDAVLSKSPARPIVNAASRREGGSSSGGVAGSVKGHPFQTPIVSPEMHEEMAKMGDFNSFVGSVHGRSGMDDCDPVTFRNSIGKPTYMNDKPPKTMQDRMAHDDWNHPEDFDDADVDPIDVVKKE